MATPARRYPFNPSLLRVGFAVETAIFDREGVLLLAKGQRITDAAIIRALRERGDLFTHELNSQSRTHIRSAYESAVLANAPLTKLDELVTRRAEVDVNRPVFEPQSPLPLTQAWTEVESSLRTALANLVQHHAAALAGLNRLEKICARLQALLRQSRDASLFILIHRAVSGHAGYSALHALVCAVLAEDTASRLPVSPSESETLVRSALTMNLSVRVLQDQLASQKTPLTQEQLLAMSRHGPEGANLLRPLVKDTLWLDVIERHHDDLPHSPALNDRPVAEKLIRVLQVIDRYTAALSPRGSRDGRDPKEAARSVIKQVGHAEQDEVGIDLLQHLGLYPPGTYVHLANGSDAVVLRMGSKPNAPWVAPLTSQKGDALASTKAVNTAEPEHAVRNGLSGTRLKIRLDEDQMVKLLTGIQRPEATQP